MGGLRFVRQNRLTKRPEYQRCYEKGRRYQTKNFIIFALSGGQGVFFWRLGTAVSRKIGSAVARNRVKRLIREVFRQHQDTLTKPIDYVVIPKRGIDVPSLRYQDIEAELVPLMLKIEKETPCANFSGA